MEKYKTTEMIRMPATSRRLAKKRFQGLNESLHFESSAVLADSFVLRNTPTFCSRQPSAAIKVYLKH